MIAAEKFSMQIAVLLDMFYDGHGQYMTTDEANTALQNAGFGLTRDDLVAYGEGKLKTDGLYPYDHIDPKDATETDWQTAKYIVLHDMILDAERLYLKLRDEYLKRKGFMKHMLRTRAAYQALIDGGFLKSMPN